MSKSNNKGEEKVKGSKKTKKKKNDKVKNSVVIPVYTESDSSLVQDIPKGLSRSDLEVQIQPKDFNSLSKTITDADENYFKNVVKTNKS